ncbi:hypothetical protein PsorP6_003335 [Peronosclerospora sorghi]|uniref:Uncharacterized protein n=1 Tax=Peronosclerospora sorghi TaxID=230839 RepID=A0ACC0VI90_9STRA|nr:hypothetical protein PsorP6_003335 [Peronosclerospora sorghi]
MSRFQSELSVVMDYVVYLLSHFRTSSSNSNMSTSPVLANNENIQFLTASGKETHDEETPNHAEKRTPACHHQSCVCK